ncbi:MAG: PPOX class F420-dependent oxidoreductase [Candidatus Limnocylindrus sp.]
MPEDTATADPRIAILQAQYVALTTYRLDGRAVVTPVWAAEREGRLLIFSNPSAGKMKRLRNSSRASVAPCTWNGTLTGAPLPATARVLAADELGGMWGALVKKYGLPAFAFRLYDRLRSLLRMQVSAGIEVSLNP